MNASSAEDRQASVYIAGILAARVLAILERVIGEAFGTRAESDSPLAGRCLLASATLAHWAARAGIRDVHLVVGECRISRPGQTPLEILSHAWCGIDGWLIDPTICQAERARFGIRLANCGPGLVAPVAPDYRWHKQAVELASRWTDTVIQYRPMTRVKRVQAALASAPDNRPERIRPLAAALAAGLSETDARS